MLKLPIRVNPVEVLLTNEQVFSYWKWVSVNLRPLMFYSIFALNVKT